MLYTQPVARLSAFIPSTYRDKLGTKMENMPASTPPIILISIMAIWLLLSLWMGGKKAYFDTWENMPEDEAEKHA